jgi:hypothetical protein
MTDCVVRTASHAGAESVGGTSGTYVVPNFNSVRAELLIRRSQPSPERWRRRAAEGEGGLSGMTFGCRITCTAFPKTCLYSFS